MTALRVGTIIVISFSFYWPAWGGVNGSPTGRVASGDPWQQWVQRGAACPIDWPFGTEVILDGTTYTCIDRGAFIGYDSRTGAPIVDFLTDRPAYRFKEQVEAIVIFPGEEIRIEGRHCPN
jgi:hypothetical protein